MLFEHVVKSADELMGVKAIFRRCEEPVMCFGSHGDAAMKTAGHFALARRAAEAAMERPYLVTIGGGGDAPTELDGRVVEVVRVSRAYGETQAFVRDELLLSWLSRWPVAVVLTEVFVFPDPPHVVRDLGFLDMSILSHVYDGIGRNPERIAKLWAALCGREIRRNWNVPCLADFREPDEPKLFGSMYPRFFAAEGKMRVEEAKRAERDPRLAAAVKAANRYRHAGSVVCEGCDLSDSEARLFDAHHLDPLHRGPRVSTLESLCVLCPTCHRHVHVFASPAGDPLPLAELRRRRLARTGE